jgi:hypothetical protein
MLKNLQKEGVFFVRVYVLKTVCNCDSISLQSVGFRKKKKFSESKNTARGNMIGRMTFCDKAVLLKNVKRYWQTVPLTSLGGSL